MLIIPAVDIKNGKCVRLTQGKIDTAVIYEDDPLKAALCWQSQGAKYLHLVDLDGAFSGEPVNFEIIKKIISSIKIPSEIGGGIRTLSDIAKYIEIGADRVILGTKAAGTSDFLQQAITLYGNKIAVGIDAENGKVVTEGWVKKTSTSAIELANKVKNIGAQTIIYTDIATDGTLKGPNFKGIEEFANAVKVNVIASGGVSSIDDIKKLKKIDGVKGAIIGKALYAGKITLSEALKC